MHFLKQNLFFKSHFVKTSNIFISYLDVEILLASDNFEQIITIITIIIWRQGFTGFQLRILLPSPPKSGITGICCCAWLNA